MPILTAAIVAAAMIGSLLASTAIDQTIAAQSLDPGSQMPFMAPQAQMPMGGPHVTSARSGLWSDPGTWDLGVPTAGANVVISTGNTVAYDLATSPTLGNIDVQGSLVFSDTHSTQLTFVNMTVEMGGFLQAGTIDSPVPSSITTTLQMAPPKEGGALIMVMGDLELHGAQVTPTWTHIASTVQPGSTTLTLADATNWKAGDHIVVASTSLKPLESEDNWIASVSGNTLTLKTPLKFEHDGVAPTQAEVEDLTRNLVVTSLDPMVHATGVMFMAGAMGGLSYTEFSHLGAKGILGDYPIHFHHTQNTMVGTIVNGVSIWDSHNRFLTIHNSDGITIENSVGYMSVGHGFFLEDGTEENNTLVNNIAILTLPGRIRPDDGGAAGFWIQNPRNNLTGNVAVSAAGSGFDFALPESAPQVIPFRQTNFDASSNQGVVPRQLKILAFVGNVAHSNGRDGFHLYRLNPVRQGTISWFRDMTMWRNNGLGAEITAAQFNVTSSTFFGNAMGNMRIDANDGTVTQSKFLGEVATTVVPGRIMVSPFGIEVTAGTATISDSLFKGHLPRGTMASADILNSPRDQQQEAVSLVDDQLLSKTQIVFGYPLNGLSYFNVVRLNGDSTATFSLVRYDLQTTVSSGSVPAPVGLSQFLSQCSSDGSYMALKCPLITPSVLKSLHG
jgi:hypothetical protein